MSIRTLRQPVLRSVSAQVLQINLDAAVVSLFRECKYLLAIGMPLPESIVALYERSEGMRVQVRARLPWHSDSICRKLNVFHMHATCVKHAVLK
jgi:hypothetical protein